MSSNQKSTLLVTGASGQLGRRVLELLLETHKGTIIAATRTPEKLTDFSNRGVIVRHADFEDNASLSQAFQGVDRLLLISTDALDVPGRRLNQHRNAIKAAEQAGVKHVVYTSIINPGPDSPAFVAPDHRGTEEALAASKLGWTALRENIYMDLLLMSVSQALQTGKLFNAIGDGKAAYITREDVARASAAALTSSFEGRRTVEITGPEAVTQYEIAEITSKLAGREITYVPITLDALVQAMEANGLPRPVAEGYASFDVAIAQGKFSAVTNTVEELTGFKPISVADFLSAHQAEFKPVTS
ncbi:MAG: SDR family oxidoreductase [Chloroflexi bacterium]|nr:SDR family oxidoreductase [Chloroflexota bacterium]MBI3167861.1 SDR family oxidoreductase [Chloroflexota bacterium]